MPPPAISGSWWIGEAPLSKTNEPVAKIPAGAAKWGIGIGPVGAACCVPRGESRGEAGLSSDASSCARVTVFFSTTGGWNRREAGQGEAGLAIVGVLLPDQLVEPAGLEPAAQTIGQAAPGRRRSWLNRFRL